MSTTAFRNVFALFHLLVTLGFYYLPTWGCKVHIFCEGHKILRNIPLTFDYTTVHTFKRKGYISQNFSAFSEYMNFIAAFFTFCHVPNVWVKKTWTNPSSDTLLQFVQIFLTQTLNVKPFSPRKKKDWVRKQDKSSNFTSIKRSFFST